MNDIGTLKNLILILVAVICVIEFVYILHLKKTNTANSLNSRLKKNDDDDDENNEYEEEIKNMVEEGLEQGVIEAEEKELINNVFEFGDKECKDVMRFRKKIAGIDNCMSIEECLNYMLEKPYSRYPLYEGDIDNILGVLYLKDVIEAFINHEEKSLSEIAREAFFVHETMEISDLFKEMQLKKIHMAIVVDEYGQTEGIVAMEDMLEVIVGNILDEYDIDEHEITKLGEEGGYLIQGVTRLDELAELLDIEFPDEDIETINGFLIDQLGHLPEDNEEVEIIYEGYSFKSMDIHEKMVRQIKVSKIEKDKGE
ncbi:MAG: hemolysin family protein [Lachnospiraceae bacterium]|nr:hemolysin family protein [Lachnospiraceae bacterium]